MRIIDTKALRDLLIEDEALVIDTREPEEFVQGHIPTAVNIQPQDADFVERVLAAAGDRSRGIALYCATRDCRTARFAAGLLEAAGFGDVSAYGGGLEEWQEWALPLVSGART